MMSEDKRDKTKKKEKECPFLMLNRNMRKSCSPRRAICFAMAHFEQSLGLGRWRVSVCWLGVNENVSMCVCVCAMHRVSASVVRLNQTDVVRGNGASTSVFPSIPLSSFIQHLSSPSINKPHRHSIDPSPSFAPFRKTKDRLGFGIALEKKKNITWLTKGT